MNAQHHVVIVGGGFGGLNAALALASYPVRVTLIDRRNFHLFQPLLYQVATGGLSPANIAAPLRAVFKGAPNVQICLAEVVDLDVNGRKVILSDGEVAYDSLVLATGAHTAYFGHDEWARYAPGLKTVEDALQIRRKIYVAFEAAERITDPAERARELTFVVIGAGPTGVELAGAIAEIARYTLRYEFKQIDPNSARILLLDLAPRVLPPYPEAASDYAAEALRRKGVELLLGVRVVDLQRHAVTIERDGQREVIEAKTIVWAAGVGASPLGRMLAEQTGIDPDRMGRVPVEPDLTVAGHPEIFVVGDLALCRGADGEPLPGIAPVAVQQGKYVAKVILARLRGRPAKPFRYLDFGKMATIGRSAAVADMRGMLFTGFTAWLLWLFVHLMKLVQFSNRVLVFVQWAWNYITWNRAARLITGDNPLPFKHK